MPTLDTLDTLRISTSPSPSMHAPHAATAAADSPVSPKVLDALCATLDHRLDHRLDALPDLLDVFASKKLLNNELTGQLHSVSTPQDVPCLPSPFDRALDASDPVDRAFAFAISGRVRNLLLGMHDDVNSPSRSRRSSATSTRSRQDSLASFSPLSLSSLPDPD